MMTSYKPGQVSAVLFASTKKAGSQDSGLAKLFSSKFPPTAVSDKPHTAETTMTNNVKENNPSPKLQENKKKKKRKHSAENAETRENTSVKGDTTSTSSFPYTHETLIQNKLPDTPHKSTVKRKLEKDTNSDSEHVGKRPRRDRKRDKQADKRTVFVGNCPLTADKQKLKKLFREFGQIETVRFRCAPSAEPKLPRRATVIMKNFHEQCDNYVAYVVFKEEEAAQKALTRNGYLLGGLHLRVDIAAMSKKHDKKRSVFVGNLPFTIKEEDIRSHFSDCGDIVNVRLVRDRMTSLGKGISYVQFESKDSVGLALKLNKSELQGRSIRVQVCTNKPQKKEEKEKAKTEANKSTKPAKKKIAFTPSNTTSSSFKAILKARRDKRFKKMKKKKKVHAKKSDGLSSIFGDAPAVTKKVKPIKAKVDKKTKWTSKSSGGKRKSHQKGSAFKGKGRGSGGKSKH